VPEPDLSQTLDFSALMAGKSSEPTAWPSPFTLGNGVTKMADLGGHHFVRMSPEANVQDALDAA
jgi:peptide/nickel transport system ATP-binding protein